MLKALRGEQILGGGFPPAPDTWDQVLAAFDKVNDDLVVGAARSEERRPERHGRLLRRRRSRPATSARRLPRLHARRPDPPSRTAVGVRAHGRRQSARDLRTVGRRALVRELARNRLSVRRRQRREVQGDVASLAGEHQPPAIVRPRHAFALRLAERNDVAHARATRRDRRGPSADRSRRCTPARTCAPRGACASGESAASVMKRSGADPGTIGRLSTSSRRARVPARATRSPAIENTSAGRRRPPRAGQRPLRDEHDVAVRRDVHRFDVVRSIGVRVAKRARR